MIPAFDLTFAGYRSAVFGVPLAIGQLDRTAARGPRGRSTVVVGFHALIDIPRVPDVQRLVRATEDTYTKKASAPDDGMMV